MVLVRFGQYTLKCGFCRHQLPVCEKKVKKMNLVNCFLEIFSHLIIFIVVINPGLSDTVISSENDSLDNFKIEGKVEVVSTSDKDWIGNTQILVEGGEYVAHLR